MESKKNSIIYKTFLGLLLFSLILIPNTQGQQLSDDFLSFFHYREIGPTRQGGRVVALAVSRQDPHTFFVGAGPGGVWKTVNNGHSFVPVFEQEDISSIGDIEIAPSNPDIIWIGTGEANLRNSTYYGNGMYKSTDGGKTWNYMGLKESHHIGRLIIHPNDPDIVYVAAQGHLYSENGERGIYKTTNGGKTWKQSLKVTIEGRHIGATDLVMDPSSPETLYAAAYDRRRWAWSFRTAGHGIYRTNDGGKSWGLASPEGKSIGNRSNYYGQIIIDPNDEDHIYVLSSRADESTDGGKTWHRAFQYAGDNHVLWIDPKNSKHMLLGYDYGMAITFDSGKNWYHPDELPMAQLYAIGVDMDYPYNVYGGMQDFGSWKGPSTKKGRFPIRFEDWEHMQPLALL